MIFLKNIIWRKFILIIIYWVIIILLFIIIEYEFFQWIEWMMKIKNADHFIIFSSNNEFKTA